MKLGFIDYYLDEWHANNYPEMIHKTSGGDMEVAWAYALIDSPLSGKSTDAWCLEQGIQRCYSIEELIDKSDGLIILSPDNCEQHEGLCQLPLRSGKPCFVDKTFTPDGAAAQRLFDIADQTATPFFTSSALRFATEFKNLRDVNQIASIGPGGVETYVIHQLEPIMMLLQTKPKRVIHEGSPQMAAFQLLFSDNRMATIHCFADGAPFMMQVVTSAENKTIEVKSDFFSNFIQELVAFMRTREPPVKAQDSISIMHTRAALLSAMESPGKWIELSY